MATWQRENQTDKAIKVILFLISPFFSFLYSLRRMNTRSSYVVFFLFAVFFGMAFTVGSGKTYDMELDGASYRQKFEDYQNISSYEYMADLSVYLSFNQDKKDFYFDTVAFIVSRYTSNYHYLFMVFATVFAFFMLKSFKFLTNHDNFIPTVASFILAFLFMSNDIFRINGVRMWTAAWVAVYSMLQIFINGDKRYYLLAFMTPFFHGAYWVFIAVLLIALLFRRYEKIWIILFFLSFFISNIIFSIIGDITAYLPSFLSRMVESYTDSDYVTQITEIRTDYSRGSGVFNLLNNLYINFLVFLFIRNTKKIKENTKTYNLYLLLLVWIVFVNFTMPVPSLGGRFMVLSYPLIAYIWLDAFGTSKYKYILYLLPLAFLFRIFQTYFIYYPIVTDLNFYFSSPFVLIYKFLIVA